MKLTRHNGRSGKHGTYNPRHNDRRFDVENSEHIDAERARQNVYWDCYRGFTTYDFRDNPEQPDFSFEEIERMYYYEHYADHVNAQNARNEKTRHIERNRTVDDLLKNNKTCPEESIYQIGTIEESVSPETLALIVSEFYEEFERRFGSHIHILDWALHLDEGTPHIHERHVFDCENRYGELCPQQEKALEELGIPLPKPEQPKGKHNNRKQTFDAVCRTILFDISVTDKGKTANTIDNCRIVFCCDPLLRDAIRLNLLTDRVDIVRDLGWRRNTSALTDTDVKYLLLYFEQNYELTSEKKITAALSIVANENCYHPIQDVLNSLVWDGTPRIRSCLHHFLGADESDYVEEMLKHFLLGAIRRVFRPGSKYEEMLCLVGGQGAGKSTFFRLLAIRDEWFSDDLKKLDDDRVFQKLQGHWIIEMSEMLATSSAKSIEEIRSFISRQKETYRTPYESQPKDRLRQCVFGGSSNTLDFLPLDRAGNRRFLPIMIYSENAEVHILEDEDASRAYLLQVWAEAMTIYRSGQYSMKFSKSIQRQLVEVQKDFMPEDTEAGQIQGFLEHYTGNMVCSKQLFKEALGHTFDQPKRWQLHNINEIMNTVVTGWKPFSNPRMFAGYGRQKGWECDNFDNELSDNEGGFVELSEEECRQLELPKEWIA